MGRNNTRPIAIKSSTVIENLAPFHIATTISYNLRGARVQMSEPYILGQNFRGTFGYLFLDMKSDIINTYENGNPFIYYRDGFLLHTDGGILLPKIDLRNNLPQIIYSCNKCSYETDDRRFRQGMRGFSLNKSNAVRNMFTFDVVVNCNSFRFETIINMKTKNKEEEEQLNNYLAEFIASLKFAEEQGLYIGKRTSKGMGKLTFKNLSFEKITQEDINRRANQIEKLVKNNGNKFTIYLLSDTIAEFPLKEEELIRAVKNASKFFDPHYTSYKEPII